MKLIDLFEEISGADEFEVIRRECRSFLEHADGHLLLRGVNLHELKGKSENVYLKQVRKDRMPRDTDPEIHQALDEWFFKKFGIHARSKSMFGVGDTERGRRITLDYGDVCAVFPRGDFKFVWSPSIKDLFDYALIHSSESAELIALLEKKGYTTSNLPKALESGHEIMVECESYFAVPLDNVPAGKLKKFLNV